MKNYRLKKEAVKFFRENLATRIHPWDVWNSMKVDDNALEEVEDAFISYGHKTSESGHSLSGWCTEKGSEFHFTIKFPSVKFGEHDKFSNGKVTRELMNRIQEQINYFYSDFVSNEIDTE